jgi:TRAP-type mannitol/chloroaromatic compound transport system permease large subunit
MPGFLLSGLYLAYIVAVAVFKPGAAPNRLLKNSETSVA